MKSIEKIAVFAGGNIEHNNEVIRFVRGDGNGYTTSAECVSLTDGCHCSRDYYEKHDYKIITYEDFKRDYLNKPVYYEIY